MERTGVWTWKRCAVSAVRKGLVVGLLMLGLAKLCFIFPYAGMNPSTLFFDFASSFVLPVVASFVIFAFVYGRQNEEMKEKFTEVNSVVTWSFLMTTLVVTLAHLTEHSFIVATLWTIGGMTVMYSFYLLLVTLYFIWVSPLVRKYYGKVLPSIIWAKEKFVKPSESYLDGDDVLEDEEEQTVKKE